LLEITQKIDILIALVVLNDFVSPFAIATENESIANDKAINSVVISICSHFK